jgi:hypothetical protein
MSTPTLACRDHQFNPASVCIDEWVVEDVKRSLVACDDELEGVTRRAIVEGHKDEVHGATPVRADGYPPGPALGELDALVPIVESGHGPRIPVGGPDRDAANIHPSYRPAGLRTYTLASSRRAVATR